MNVPFQNLDIYSPSIEQRPTQPEAVDEAWKGALKMGWVVWTALFPPGHRQPDDNDNCLIQRAVQSLVYKRLMQVHCETGLSQNLQVRLYLHSVI